MVRVPPFPLLSSLARASWMFFSAVSSRASITSNAWSCIPGLAHLNLRKSLAGTFNSNAASVTLQPWRARAATHGMVEISDRGGDVWFLGGEVADAHLRFNTLSLLIKRMLPRHNETATESILHTLVPHEPRLSYSLSPPSPF